MSDEIMFDRCRGVLWLMRSGPVVLASDRALGLHIAELNKKLGEGNGVLFGTWGNSQSYSVALATAPTPGNTCGGFWPHSTSASGCRTCLRAAHAGK